MALRMSLDKQLDQEYVSIGDPATDDHRNMTFVDDFVTNNRSHNLPPQQHANLNQTYVFQNINNPAKNNQMMQHHDSVESSSSTTIEDICGLDFCELDSSSSTSIYTISPPPPSPQNHQYAKLSVHTPATTLRPHQSVTSSATVTITYANTDIHHYNTDTVESTVNEVHKLK